MRNSRDITTKKNIFWFVVLLFLFGYTILHIKAGMVYPLPYDDETAFYYPSKAFSEENNFFTTTLNSKREVFWMPTGFMVFTGLIFKVTDPSLVVGRWISYAFASLCFIILSYIIGKHTDFDIPSIIILGLTFVSRHWVYVGNMMRMEMMMLFISVLGAYLVYRKRALAGISICMLSLLIHPNGLYFLIFASIYELIIYKGKNIIPSFTKGQIIVALFPLLCIFSYIIYILPNIEYFISDWKFQLSTRSSQGLISVLFRLDQIIFTAVFVTCAYIILKIKKEDWLFLTLLAVTLCLARIFGQAYPIFRIISVALTAIVIYQICRFYILHLGISKKAILSTGIFFLLILSMFAGTIINLPYKKGMEVLTWKKDYYKEADIKIISKHLNSSFKIHPFIYFIPVSDGILFDHIENKKWTHRLNVFDTVRYDAFVIHESKYNDLKSNIETIEKNYPEFENHELGNPIHIRDSTEKWYLVVNKLLKKK